MWNCNRQHLKATATMNCYSTKRGYLAGTRELPNVLSIQTQKCTSHEHLSSEVVFSLWTTLKVNQLHPPDRVDRNYWRSFVHGNQLLDIQIFVAEHALCLQHVTSTSKVWGRQKWGRSRDIAPNNLELRLSTWRSNSDVWGLKQWWAMESTKNEKETVTTRRLEQKELAQHSALRVSWDEIPQDEPEAPLHMEHRCVHLAELSSLEQEHLWGMNWSLTPEDIEQPSMQTQLEQLSSLLTLLSCLPHLKYSLGGMERELGRCALVRPW